MRAVASPEWSFGRDSDLLRRMRDILESEELWVHDCSSDIDMNRSITAFSGPWSRVQNSLYKLCELAFDRINLSRHLGTHPRTGALDLCPVFSVSADDVESFASGLAERFSLPTFLMESSMRPGREPEIESIREGGFGGLFFRLPNPDFGPQDPHPQLGVALVGLCEPNVAFDLVFKAEDQRAAKDMVSKIEELRSDGDLRFLGLSAAVCQLPTQGMCALRVKSSTPSLASVDDVVEWMIDRCGRHGVSFMGAVLRGAIWESHLAGCTRLRIKKTQVVSKELPVG